MKTKEFYKLRDKLLLFNYFFYSWYQIEKSCFERVQYENFDGFLRSVSPVVMNKVLYLLCLCSSSHDNIGLFAFFDLWRPYDTGPVCDEIYCNRSLLYTIECISNDSGTMMVRRCPKDDSDVIRMNYQDLEAQNIDTDEKFIKYIRSKNKKLADEIDAGMVNLFKYPEIVRFIINRDYVALRELSKRAILWETACLAQKPERLDMKVDNPELLCEEKKMIFGVVF